MQPELPPAQAPDAAPPSTPGPDTAVPDTETPAAAAPADAVATTLATQPPAITPLVGGDSELLSPAGTLQVFASLMLVLMVIVALGWVSRRMPRLTAQRGRALRVVDMLPLGARERVILVEVNGTQLVLGMAPGRVQTLHVFDGDTPTPPAAANDADGRTSAPGVPHDNALAPSPPEHAREVSTSAKRTAFATLLRARP